MALVDNLLTTVIIILLFGILITIIGKYSKDDFENIDEDELEFFENEVEDQDLDEDFEEDEEFDEAFDDIEAFSDLEELEGLEDIDDENDLEESFKKAFNTATSKQFLKNLKKKLENTQKKTAKIAQFIKKEKKARENVKAKSLKKNKRN